MNEVPFRIEFDEGQIRREVEQKVPGIYELRILCGDNWRTKMSAYFHTDDPDDVIDQVLRHRYPANCCVNFFLTSNPCKSYCEAREQFGYLRKSRVMTQDDDIERLTWLVLDIDSKHPTGVSATDEEKEAARTQAEDAIMFLTNAGFDSPEIVDSGNGYHIKYRIDLPNDDEGQGRLSNVADAISERFPLCDAAVKNPSRILKLPGTKAMKGRSTEGRPHRMARILSTASPMEV